MKCDRSCCTQAVTFPEKFEGEFLHLARDLIVNPKRAAIDGLAARGPEDRLSVGDHHADRFVVEPDNPKISFHPLKLVHGQRVGGGLGQARPFAGREHAVPLGAVVLVLGDTKRVQVGHWEIAALGFIGCSQNGVEISAMAVEGGFGRHRIRIGTDRHNTNSTFAELRI